MGNFSGMVVALAFVMAPGLAFGWSEHHRVTRQALGTLPGIEGRTVVVTPFQAVIDHAPALLAELGYDPAQGFNETIRIRKDFKYGWQAGEREGEPIAAIDVLATYSDEPDWKMDTELFDEDQYPELWKDEYAMMGGRKGTPSQAFRHMYWTGIRLAHPLSSLHLPPSTIFRSMGEAHERAKVFVTLSRAAAKIPGLEYWSMRFLSNALHYLEDVAQPFHASQIPSPKFLSMPFFDRERGSGGKDLVKQVTHIVSYYHFAYEGYVAYAMRSAADGTGGPETHAIVDALVEAPRDRAMKGIDYADRDPSRLIREMGKKSVAKAGKAGGASYKFFPEIAGKFADLDAQAQQDDAWWAEAVARGQADSPTKRDYFETVTTMFSMLGESVRRIVGAELPTRQALSAR